MKIRKVMLWSKFVGAAAFTILFPGFFFYHYGAGRGFYGLFLGGLYGTAVMALIAPLLAAAISRISSNPRIARSRGIALFAVLILWTSIWFAINYAIDPHHPGHQESAGTIVMWISLFCMGLVLPLDSRVFVNIIRVSWLGMLLISLISADFAHLRIPGASVEGVASYQQMARSMLLVSAIVVVTALDMRMRVVSAGCSLLVLFLIGARSEFYGFIAGYTMVEFIISRKSALGFTMFCIGVISTLMVIAYNFQIFYVSRQAELFDLSDSSSWVARNYLLSNALGQIVENPILGVYAGHWILGEGSYAHNALSAWVGFGIFGFLVYTSLCIGSAWSSVKSLLHNPNGRWAQLATLMNIYTVLLVVMAKPVYWEIPAFAWATAIVAYCATFTTISDKRSPLRFRSRFVPHSFKP